MPDEVSVLIADRAYVARPDRPLRFGRSDRVGVVGLDADDMGISAVAGVVRQEWGTWWLENQGRKRPLLLGDGSGAFIRRLECGQRRAIDRSHLIVLVPGALHSHRVEVVTIATGLRSVAGAQRDAAEAHTTETAGVRLGERDKDVLVALLGDYLDGYPARPVAPRTYREAAELLGPPWTRESVRKQIARVRHRVARVGPVFAGPEANYDLADHLVVHSLLVPADRNRLEGQV